VAGPDVHVESNHHAFLKIIDSPPDPPSGASTRGSGPRVTGRPAWCHGTESMTPSHPETLMARMGAPANSMPLSHDNSRYLYYSLPPRAGSSRWGQGPELPALRRRGPLFKRSERLGAVFFAAGRPVVSQATAFGKFVPTARGCSQFTALDEHLAALEAITSTLLRAHVPVRPRAIAEAYFKAETVLARLSGSG